MTFGPKSKNKPKKSATDYALWLLGLRGYSEHELRTKLTQKSYLKTEIDEAISKLKKHRLIDDKQLAIGWINSRDFSRPRSEYLLKMELRKKGISSKDIDLAFLECARDSEISNDNARAKKLITQYKDRSNIQKKDKYEKKKYFLALLARRGFSYDKAQEVIGEME
ncbi:MAG: Regulatory protein RecX [Berkelbacteria bacterium GW2011_GWA2_38_9]|uniref:Regulatory protein RecX n=2 Tax=Bacteria candidate phyla TaxID=1783234 RepID=A0A0G0PJF3_9BACT|nr:MAG: Regulatory protein RecX [Berkelbacteria bacterium GW2011_GWA2_38_9]KKR32966.1 MAG: Regulatory protein RecX [Candidatus Gottesmanbacteria bacterium GW2011_GWC2_39_8]